MTANVLHLDSLPGAGTYWVYYSFTDSLGCTSVDSSSYTTSIIIHSTGSAEALDVAIFPNPANEKISVSWVSNASDANFILFDLSGKAIRNWGASGSIGKTQLELNGISTGMYLLKCDFGGLTQTFQLSIAH